MKKIHTNMFDHYESRREVYQGFLQHQASNGKWLTFCILACVFAYVVSVLGDMSRPATFIFQGLSFFFAMAALFTFVDMSNRNTMLHLFDYMEERDRTKR